MTLLENVDYDPSSGDLTVTQTGIYWMYMFIGVKNMTPAALSLRFGSSEMRVLLQAARMKGINTLSMGFVIPLGLGDKVMLSSSYPTASVHQRQTCLAGFSFGSIFDKLVVFRVESTLMAVSETSTDVTFDNILTNEGGGWNENINAFRATVDGVYFFSLTVNLYYDSSSSNEMQLKLNSNAIVSCMPNKVTNEEITRLSLSSTMTSGSLLISMNKNDLVSVVVIKYVQQSLNIRPTFSGFFYAPKFTQTHIVWSLLLTDGERPVNDCSTFTNNFMTGVLFHNSNNTLIVQASGVYYVHLDVITYNAIGVSEVHVFRKNDTIMMVYHSISESIPEQVGSGMIRNSAALLHLEPGDILSVNFNKETSFLSSRYAQFYGLCLYCIS